MSKSFILAVGLLLGSAVPVLAQGASACLPPIAPAPIDGATATEDQLRGANRDVKQFLADSDAEQDCLGKEIDDAKAKAAADKKPVDQSIVAALVAKINDNQKMKEKVGGEFNAAVGVYKKAHPKP